MSDEPIEVSETIYSPIPEYSSEIVMPKPALEQWVYLEGGVLESLD